MVRIGEDVMAGNAKTKWISSKEALAKYEQSNGGRAALKRSLAEHFLDANVRTRGVLMDSVQAVSAKLAWKKTAKLEGDYERVEIVADKWRKSTRWSADQDEWRWNAGNFSVSFASKPRKRIMIRKLELCEADLKKILNPPAPKSKGGRRADVAAWQDFYFAVIRLTREGKLNPTSMPDTAKLWKEIAERMEGGEFGHKIMKAAVTAVFNEFVADDKIIADLEGRNQRLP